MCHKAERPFTEKQQFYDDLACKWNLCISAKMEFGLGDFNGHDEILIDGLKEYMKGTIFGAFLVKLKA